MGVVYLYTCIPGTYIIYSFWGGGGCSSDLSYNTFYQRYNDAFLTHEQVFTHNNIIIVALDLLRIDVQSFTEFCSDFLSRNNGYFVSPLHLSGSAVESIFGEFKYNARGKLDASNYQVARAALLTK